MALPSALAPWIESRFMKVDDDGVLVPNSSGTINTYNAGTLVAASVFTDVNRAVAHANPIVLDDEGRPPSPIYVPDGGLKFVVKDSDGNTLYTVDNVSDIGLTVFESIGEELQEGSEDVTSGYTVTADDLFVTVDSTGGADPCVINLPSCADRGQPVAIKNMGTVALAVTPNGSDTIDTVAGVFTVSAASSPTFPCIWLLPDSVSNWKIVASHGL